MPASNTPAPTQGFLDVAGQRLAWTRWGPPPEAGPTLVLLHEGLGSVSLWRDLPERLVAATGLGVFAWSRAGYGQSSPRPAPPWPLTYLHDEALRCLPQVLDKAVPGPHYLIGHSDGASIALLYAGTVPDPRVRGLVLVAPHVVVEPMCVAAIAHTGTLYETTDLRARLARHHGAKTDDTFWGWNGAWRDPLFATWDLRIALRGLTRPVLVVQGDDDAYGTALQPALVRRHCAGPVSVAFLPACGHGPHRDQPDALVALIAAHVAHGEAR
ncbi:alpha/beta fold hydrolase [Pararhodospirillum oryzae]|uniref:Hydrolase n=1 Tax=Pararhodospirillum oryzae TaxID=478448 RepID=A0A512H7E1_9PROT|nr:alpha/beta hydrolase [Pararhodospirillum oryzae]GEO81361.1 hydrolase [Pararhodospirillum oryzae]